MSARAPLFYDRAVELCARAVALDDSLGGGGDSRASGENGAPSETTLSASPVRLYAEACEYFLAGYRLDTNSARRALVLSRVRQFIARAEALKAADVVALRSRSAPAGVGARRAVHVEAGGGTAPRRERPPAPRGARGACAGARAGACLAAPDAAGLAALLVERCRDDLAEVHPRERVVREGAVADRLERALDLRLLLVRHGPCRRELADHLRNALDVGLAGVGPTAALKDAHYPPEHGVEDCHRLGRVEAEAQIERLVRGERRHDSPPS